MSTNKTVVKCPTCEQSVVWSASATFRPFCSERCKLIDLGEWASEEKRIAGESLPPSANESDAFSDSY